MKLKEFNPANCIPEKSAKSAIVSMNLKNGLFAINNTSCELIGLKDGDHVVFHQDENDPTNWYLEKVVKSTGWEVRAKANLQGGLLFNNTKLAREIAKSVEFTGNTGRMLLAGKPTEFGIRKLFGILTIGLKNQE